MSTRRRLHPIVGQEVAQAQSRTEADQAQHRIGVDHNQRRMGEDLVQAPHRMRVDQAQASCHLASRMQHSIEQDQTAPVVSSGNSAEDHP